jgi:hypothetical protein
MKKNIFAFYTLNVSLFFSRIKDSRRVPWRESYWRGDDRILHYCCQHKTKPTLLCVCVCIYIYIYEYVVFYILSRSLLTCRRSWSQPPSFQKFKDPSSLSLVPSLSSSPFLLFLSHLFYSRITIRIFTYQMRLGSTCRWDLFSIFGIYGFYKIFYMHKASVSSGWDSFICGTDLKSSILDASILTAT